jgi:hypothetical protein
MPGWAWIIIGIAAAIVLLAVLYGATVGRRRRLERNREHAGRIRAEAEARGQRAEQRAELAREQVAQAERERVEADQLARRADTLDPDVDADETTDGR